MMPLYDFKCSSGHTFERMVPLKDFEAPQHCSCQSPAIRVISAPMFTVDHTGYNCPVTDKWIGSKREHEENLRLTGSRVMETGEKELNDQFRAQEETRFDKAIEDTVEKTIEGWDSGKKETLHNELINGGLSAEVVRA